MCSTGLAYPISTTGVIVLVLRNSAVIARTSFSPTLFASARSDARWITGPSAMGSENGTPSSMMSAPASTSACINGTVRPLPGSPAVMNGIRAFLFCACSAVKVSPMRLMVWSSENSVRMGMPGLQRDPRYLRHGVDVLVTASGQVHQDDLVLAQGRREFLGVGHGMAGFERGDDAFVAAQVM